MDDRTLRTCLVMMVVQFLFWCGTASTWATYSEMFIARECEARGVDPCKKDRESA